MSPTTTHGPLHGSSVTHTHTGPGCPGADHLLSGVGCRYLRLMFTVYWMGASPQALDLYYTHKRVWLDYKGIQQLQSDVLALIEANITDRACVDVVFTG